MKKFLLWAVVILVLFFIVRNPAGAASVTHRIGAALISVADGIGQFLSSLFG